MSQRCELRLPGIGEGHHSNPILARKSALRTIGDPYCGTILRLEAAFKRAVGNRTSTSLPLRALWAQLQHLAN